MQKNPNATTLSFAQKASTFLLLLALTLSGSISAQTSETTPCTTDSLKIETNDTQWQVINNNFGATNNVNAKIVSTQYNSITGFNAVWISYKTDWLQYTTYSTTTSQDSFMTLRYTFKNCGADTVRFNFLVRRDNYCDVTLDGTTSLLHDLPTDNTANYTGTQINTAIYLDTCTHYLDFKVYNRASFTGGNGFGLLVGGWLISKSHRLFTNAAGCENFACCRSTNGIGAAKQDEEIKVYPNPASETIAVTLPQSIKNGSRYILQNYMGQTVLQGQLAENSNKTSLSIGHLSDGVYILRIDGYNYTARIVKQ